jgi:hypothetical protein
MSTLSTGLLGDGAIAASSTNARLQNIFIIRVTGKLWLIYVVICIRDFFGERKKGCYASTDSARHPFY